MSRKYYYAAFMPAEEGGYDIVVPDLPEVASCCESLEHGSALTVEALEMILRDRLENEGDIPEPSCLEDIQARTREHLEEIEHEPAGEIIYKRIPVACRLDASRLDERKPVSLELPAGLAEKIRSKAAGSGLTEAEFLHRAIEAYSPGEK